MFLENKIHVLETRTLISRVQAYVILQSITCLKYLNANNMLIITHYVYFNNIEIEKTAPGLGLVVQYLHTADPAVAQIIQNCLEST